MQEPDDCEYILKVLNGVVSVCTKPIKECAYYGTETIKLFGANEGSYRECLKNKL